MNVVLFDEELNRKNLLPLTFTRPVALLRLGILTIKEKWELHLNTAVSYLTQEYLSKKFPLFDAPSSLCVNGKLLPNEKLVAALKNLGERQALYKGAELLAWRGSAKEVTKISSYQKVDFQEEVHKVEYVWDLFQKNGQAILADFDLLTRNKRSVTLSDSVTVIGDRALVFLEEGAKAEACILNTSSGPIYIGKDAEIMEGSIVRGPFALGEHSALKLGTKIYGPTTIGPHCKVGGEVNNSVIFGLQQ